MEKAKDAKAKAKFQLPSRLEKLILNAIIAIARQSKRTKKTPIESTTIGLSNKTKNKLRPITSLLLISSRLWPLKRVKRIDKKAFLPLESTSPR